MSISKKAFFEGKFNHLGHSLNNPINKRITARPKILKFLEDHDKAYTIKEIQKHLSLKDWNARTALRRLVKGKHVLHKAPYFMRK